METSIVIIIIGLFIFWGNYLNQVFERRNIPDVLGLMFIGMLIGPVFHVVDPESFGRFGSLFSNLVLIFILFESGIDLKISEVKASFKDSATITTVGFLVTCITITVSCIYIFNLSLLSSLFIGSTLGGTSSAVVVGLVKKINVLPKTSTTLIMESAETDVFTLAVPLSILGLMLTGDIEPHTVVLRFVASLVFAVLIGVLGGFLWSYILNKFSRLKATKFSTPAFLFILYGISEYLNFSGPLTALSFGITIGNMQYIEPRVLESIIPNQNIVLPRKERIFFGEIVFLLRTFFFVFIGISIQINRLDWLMWGALITVFVFVTRIFVVRFVISKSTPLLDKSVMSVMVPKGLGAAVIATLPLQKSHPDGVIIQSICFSVILFSTIYCVLLFFIVKTGVATPLYRIFYGKDG
jgi:cell volume regulation protein A